MTGALYMTGLGLVGLLSDEKLWRGVHTMRRGELNLAARVPRATARVPRVTAHTILDGIPKEAKTTAAGTRTAA